MDQNATDGVWRGSFDELFSLVYEELRQIAGAQLKSEPLGITLSATAIVSEVYLRLSKRTHPWVSRAQFFRAAAESMRFILIDAARRRRRMRESRSGIAVDLTGDMAGEESELEFLSLALNDFQKREPRACDVVKLRFFAGLKLEEIAPLLGVSSRTVKRDWDYARSWLKDRMQRNS